MATLLCLVTSIAMAGKDETKQSSQQPQLSFPVFTNVTAAAGLAATGTPFGNPSWGDFDGDGYLDLWVDNHYNSPPYFYKNNGDGTFTNIFASTGMEGKGDKHGNGLCDYNNDGLLDLHITTGARHGTTLGTKSDRTEENLGGFIFSDVTVDAGTDDTWGQGRSVAWGDYDRDGYPDLLLGNLATDLVLYHNNGDGTFTNMAIAAGLGSLQYNEVDFADYNNDGYPDIFMSDVEASHANRDKLFKNNGDGTFTDVTDEAGIQPLTEGRSAVWGDFNNDGNLDLFVSRGTDVAVKQTLYKNNGDGTFTDVTDAAGLGALSNNRAAGWGDFDNDGYLDLYVVNSGTDPDGKGPNYLYQNKRDGTFKDVAARAGVQAMAVSRGRGASWGDYDNDGFLDIFTNNGEDNTDFVTGPLFLFHNEGDAFHWLKIKLVGTVSNRDGLGARVVVTAGQQVTYRENNGSMGHYLSQQSTPLHFGLGKSTKVKSVVITWPSGIIQTLSRVPADQELVVTESQ
ncbi:MAG TPA: CRTAC1 family protein [Chthoniobacterales bacterium]